MFEKLRIHLSQVFAVTLVVIIMFSKSVWATESPLLSGVLFLMGIVLAGIGSLGRMWCSLYIAGYKTSSLVTAGPYSICRNPLYLFSIIGALGVGFASRSFLIPTLILIAFALYYPGVIKSEEQELLKLHKEQADKYFSNVPKFFPKLTFPEEPEDYTVKPRIFRNHILSAIWFIWLVGLLELIRALRETRILPTLFTIF